MSMDIQFLGAVRTVTGSKYLIKINNKRILVDCGLYQGYKELRLRNRAQLPIKPERLDAVILTHAHIDHSGYVPLLIKNGYKGKIYCTKATYDLCAILLPDAGFLEEEDANRANRYGYSKHKPALPLFTRADAIASLDHFNPVDYHERIQLDQDISYEHIPAGHILGSSMVIIRYGGRSLLFTGDMGRQHHPIMKPPEQVQSIDYLVIESTYGDRLHDESNPQDQLEKIVNDTYQRNGSVIIPAFAVGRSQDILYYLHQLKITHRIPDLPIYLDSPMAQDVSELLMKYANEHRLTHAQSKEICKTATYTRSAQESKQIMTSTSPRIIISASGMATGGRVLHHLKAFLPNANNTIVFTGYQDPGTRGDKLVSGEQEIKIHGEFCPVRAKVVQMKNLSAHADYTEMIIWLKSLNKPPQRIFITHGSLTSALAFKDELSKLFKCHITVPDYLDHMTLI